MVPNTKTGMKAFDHVSGVIVHTTAEMSLVECVSDQTIMYVRNNPITYRMGLTIDEDLPSCHVKDIISMKPVRTLGLDTWVKRKPIDIETSRKRTVRRALPPGFPPLVPMTPYLIVMLEECDRADDHVLRV